MKKISSVILGKSIFSLSRLLKLGGGYAAPGLYALKIEPDLVSKLINPAAQNIIITGTNGKTTTSNLISHFLKTSGEKVLKNSSGSNLERGIASYLVRHASLGGKLNYDFGVWELDEFAFNSVAQKIKPKVVILLNAFRDQLDRYGEVNTVINRWKETLKKLSTETILIINADDGNLEKAVEGFKGKIIRFGVKNKKITGESRKSGTKKLDYEAQILKSKDLYSTFVKVNLDGKEVEFGLPLPGVFNAYNFLAALALSHQFNLDISKVKESLKEFTPSFGRFEKFEAGKIEGNIFLIKNPVGATQVLETISSHLSPKDTLLMALNDNFADGTDVSWIWDIEIERLKINDLRLKIFVSGSRTYDMALRLKYAGFENIKTEENLGRALNKAISETEGKLYVLPTYTALLELQKILVKKGIKKEYWKNE